mmetsp:Transcript_21380/g.21710  ORF Transcript_21380/g.21710 Transcript_21380/m.21710 type:complete len:181 (+) Transcript_21380:414-956(+)
MEYRCFICCTHALGTGSPISGSAGQKVNSRSLTEAKLVGVDGAIEFMKWASLYCKEQVKKYPPKHPFKNLGKKNVVIQNNTSTIKMVKGGKRVCDQRLRNIDIRYFYAHERVNDGTIVVTYCPTKKMVSNYLSELLQGSLFRTHCNTFMGITLEQADQYKLEYAAEKALRAKAVSDHLSV